MAWVPFDYYLKKLLTQDDAIDHDAAGTTIKIMMSTVTYSPDRAANAFKSDVTNEVTGTNYTAGGNAIANKTVTVASNVIKFDADDPATWTQSGTGFSNARIAILYKDTGTASTSPLIAYYNFGSDKGNVAGDLTLQLDSAGIATLAGA
jgi:hypothetical protein